MTSWHTHKAGCAPGTLWDSLTGGSVTASPSPEVLSDKYWPWGHLVPAGKISLSMHTDTALQIKGALSEMDFTGRCSPGLQLRG